METSQKRLKDSVRGKGLTVDDIEFREVKGEEYVYVTKHEAGKPAKEVLAGVPEVLASLTFLSACTGLTTHLNTFAQFTP